MPPPNRTGNPGTTEVFQDRDPGKVHGVVLGIVTSTADPLQRGRVQITLPWLPGASTLWAMAAFPPGLATSGYQVGDQVVVAFDHGQISSPIVLGRVGS